MQVLMKALLLAVLVYGGGGVTKPSGIEQFWTDDYKVFERIYGKTSDKDIYGSTLPGTITYGDDIKKKETTEKKERYALNYDLDNESDLDFYNAVRPKQSLGTLSKKRPATSTINFISYSDFKPISPSTDPETYNYLKHLEITNKENKFEYPKAIGGFKPYSNYVGPNPEDTDAYKSIQDILDAHEANKGNNFKSNDDDKINYMTHEKSKKKKPHRVHNSSNKPRCNGRCRKRSNPVRVRSRPYVRKINHRVVNY